jgi:hypothetical protein
MRGAGGGGVGGSGKRIASQSQDHRGALESVDSEGGTSVRKLGRAACQWAWVLSLCQSHSRDDGSGTASGPGTGTCPFAFSGHCNCGPGTVPPMAPLS